MRKSGKSALTGVSLAATAVVTTAAAALVSTWTFSPGGTFTATNVGNVTLHNIDKGSSGTCNSSTATVTAKVGSGHSGTGLLSVNALTLDHNMWPSTNECAGPNNIKVSITLLGLPWRFDALSYDAATGKTTGKLVGLGANIHGGDGCDLTVGGPGSTPGEVPAVYTNSTRRVSINGGNLVIKTADAQCDPTLFAAGDHMRAIGTYYARTAQTVTSP